MPLEELRSTGMDLFIFRIHESLNDLTALAKQVDPEDEIAQKIHQFSGEVLFNFLARYRDHSKELQSVLKFPSSKRLEQSREDCAKSEAAISG